MEALKEVTNDEGSSSGRNSSATTENIMSNKTGIKIKFKLPRKSVPQPVESSALEDPRATAYPVKQNNVESEGPSMSKQKRRKEVSDHVAVSRKLNHVCHVCRKEFPFEDSLHGHMRIHLDKPYGGTQPSLSTPENNTVTSLRDKDPVDASTEGLSSSTSDRLDHVDLLITTGWAEKRKRSSSVSSESSLSRAETEKSSLPRILMQLSREQHEKELIRERRKAKAKLCGSTKLEWDSDDEYWNQDCFPPGFDDKFRRDFEAKTAAELGLSKDSFQINGGVEAASGNKKNKLDDHSSHHENAGPAASTFVEQPLSEKRKKLDPLSSLHQCQSCHKTFPTRQVLGGHMRAHYMKPEANSVESIQEFEAVVAEHVLQLAGTDESQSKQEEGSDRSTGRVVFSWDLNEVPPNDEDMEDDHGCEMIS